MTDRRPRPESEGGGEGSRTPGSVGGTGRQATVTFVLADLAGNPLARTVPLAAALRRDYAVQAVGLLAPGAAVYAPYRDELPIVAVPGSPRDPRAVARLARRIEGDVVVACKPVPATLVAALAGGRLRGRAVILDVDDDEWSEVSVEPGGGLRRRISRLADVHALLARAAHPLTWGVDAATVASRALQRRYGGTLIRHGPDESLFSPERFTAADRREARARFGLPRDGPIAVFAGVPRIHKGWEVLVEALGRPEAAAWSLVGVGERGANWFSMARDRLGARFHHLPLVSRSDMPLLLSAVDAAPIPQLAVAFAESQLPAKLLEAMAMELPVVATPVGDLAEILGDGERGCLVPAGDAPALAEALGRIAAAPGAARAKAAAARTWFLAEASTSANRERFGAVVREALDRADRRRQGRRAGPTGGESP